MRRTVTRKRAKELRDRVAMSGVAYLEPIPKHDLLALADTLEQQAVLIDELRNAVTIVLKAHALVQMDSPEDKALHAEAMDAMTGLARRLGVKP